ncbi:hypothetical protein FRC04_002650 [Tulasnella sp. 424]|nr:hypothetical protein FRC04_002650 [Tulasnella sp. 424]KAG8974160.1 hypothetical protein FRC05_007736 [Tulasnella sp. 425]
MASRKDIHKRIQRADMTAQVADIYEQYVFDLIKSKQEAIDAIRRQMLEIDARMKAEKSMRQKAQEFVDGQRNLGNREAAALAESEIIDLSIEYWSLMAERLQLSQAGRTIEVKRRDLEWQRSQVVQAYWANVRYAKILERDGSPRAAES